MQLVFGILAAYVVGSIPFGLLLSRVAGREDPRRAGSGNIGATNVARTGGLGLGIATLLLDVAKGFSGVLVGRFIADADPGTLVAALLVAAPVLGHVYPVWLGFRGGKGVAAAAGVLAIADPLVLLVAAVVFFALAVPSRWVSLGSIGAGVAAVMAALVWHGTTPTGLGILIAGLVIVWRHRENGVRILRGEESRFGTRAGDSKEA